MKIYTDGSLLPDTPPRLIVHLVHGTAPYGMLTAILARLRRKPQRECRLAPRPLWFEPGSAFWKILETSLGPNTVLRSFHWSARNSFTARRRASDELREYLDRSIEDEPRACHVLVGHSHGGNVAIDAMNRPLREWRPASDDDDGTAARENDDEQVAMLFRHLNVAGLITLSTPFLHHEAGILARPAIRQDSWLRGGSRALVYLCGLGIALCVAARTAGCRGIQGGPAVPAALVVTACAALAWAAVLHAIPRSASRKIEPVGASPEGWIPVPHLLLRARADEASLSLGFGQAVQRLRESVVRASLAATGHYARGKYRRMGISALTTVVLMAVFQVIVLGLLAEVRCDGTGLPLLVLAFAGVFMAAGVGNWVRILDAVTLFPVWLVCGLLFGWDSLALLLTGAVDVESIPTSRIGGTSEARTVNPAWMDHDAMISGRTPESRVLRHSIAEFKGTGRHVAEWIAERRLAWMEQFIGALTPIPEDIDPRPVFRRDGLSAAWQITAWHSMAHAVRAALDGLPELAAGREDRGRLANALLAYLMYRADPRFVTTALVEGTRTAADGTVQRHWWVDDYPVVVDVAADRVGDGRKPVIVAMEPAAYAEWRQESRTSMVNVWEALGDELNRWLPPVEERMARLDR